MEWISIEDKLPDLDKEVLFTYEDYVNLGSYIFYDPGFRWLDHTGHLYRSEVTHWMPLPKIPEKRKRHDRSLRNVWNP
jgi:hypothetical protein